MANPNPTPPPKEYQIGQPKGISPGRPKGVLNVKRRIAKEVAAFVEGDDQALPAIIRALFKIAKDPDHPKQLQAAQEIDMQLDGAWPKEVRVDMNLVADTTRTQLEAWGVVTEVEDAAFKEIPENGSHSGEDGSNGESTEGL